MTEYPEEDYLPLSGLQHFLFCRRQWALIHIEGQWSENFRTVDGTLLHERAHNEALREKRGAIVTVRGIRVFSAKLGLSGQCDVLELHRSDSGAPIPNLSGKWLPFPVEYKRGAPKTHSCDTAQLCAQAMCLEDMLCCSIPAGALFYGETKRREPVTFTCELRELVQSALSEMHDLYRRGRTPRVRPTKACKACSLQDICLPSLEKAGSVSAYLSRQMEDDP